MLEKVHIRQHLKLESTITNQRRNLTRTMNKTKIQCHFSCILHTFRYYVIIIIHTSYAKYIIKKRTFHSLNLNLVLGKTTQMKLTSNFLRKHEMAARTSKYFQLRCSHLHIKWFTRQENRNQCSKCF